jgi:hypothetical protein
MSEPEEQPGTIRVVRCIHCENRFMGEDYGGGWSICEMCRPQPKDGESEAKHE